MMMGGTLLNYYNNQTQPLNKYPSFQEPLDKHTQDFKNKHGILE